MGTRPYTSFVCYELWQNLYLINFLYFWLWNSLEIILRVEGLFRAQFFHFIFRAQNLHEDTNHILIVLILLNEIMDAAIIWAVDNLTKFWSIIQAPEWILEISFVIYLNQIKNLNTRHANYVYAKMTYSLDEIFYSDTPLYWCIWVKYFILCDSHCV